MAEQAFLNAATREILKKLISLAAGEIGLVWSFKPTVKRLGKRFQQAQNLLSDAADNPRLMGKKTVQDWLKDLNAAASDAEDVLDEIAFELLRRKLEVNNRRIRIGSKVRNFFCLSNPLAFRLRMGHKINNINLLFDQIYRQANEIGLRAVDVINPTIEHTETRKTHPFVDDSLVVGREGDVSKVVEMLLCSDNDGRDLPVISIVGMAGLGKTTLAQLVYKDERVVRNFGERMWVCISKDFKIERLLNEMAQSVAGTNCEMSNIEAMIKKLHDHLNGKSYLLFLDDVWNENHEKWEQMRNLLLGIGGARGSKVMVTTRSEVVVSTMQAPSALIHHLERLSENDSWTLFKQRAFAEGGPVQSSNLMAVGESLVKRCGGLPLAIKVLGALMHSKKNENEWELIERSEIWNLHDDVLPSLRLSFDHLPSSSLKQCFAYCSIIPKHSRIYKADIVELWMAQGFLEPPQGSNLGMEDLGDEYFDILLWNSLFQDAKKDRYGNITSCKIHDLLYELAVHISKDYCLTTETGILNDDSRVQHLCLADNINLKVQSSRGSSQKLRTLVFRGDNLGDSLREIRCLRALDLNASHIEELSISIGKLIHLRYIDISCTPIKTLPDSITGLYNLQSLTILNCTYLKTLPSEFKNLISLRHFYMDDDEKHRNLMPIGMGQLTCLQTLPFFVVGQDKGCRMEELGCLHNLKGVLKVYRLEHVTSKNDAEQANLSSKSKLQRLKFHWSSEREADPIKDVEVLEGLKPHNNLKGLKIENFGGRRLASWIVMNDNLPCYGLVKLKLRNCKRLEFVPVVGHFPHLKVLAMEGLHNVKCIDFEFYGVTRDGREVTSAFPSLRELSLIDMPNLVEWSEAQPELNCSVFPCLEMLRIERCPQLSSIPSNFPSIKKLLVKKINSMALLKMSSKLTSLNSLEIVKASGPEVDSVIKNLLKSNTSLLKELKIEKCGELSCLPKELVGLAALETLIVWFAPNLTLFPDIGETDSLATCLQRFDIRHCYKLSNLPNGLRNLKSLENLCIFDCPNLNLMSITNNNQSNGDIGCLTSLLELLIAYCGTSLSRSCCDIWPGWVFSLTGLRELGIGGFFEELDYFPWPSITTTTDSSSTNSQKLPPPLALPLHLHFRSLKTLVLYGWPKLKSLPNQLQHFTALTYLTISMFSGLIALPDWLGDLSSLKTLRLIRCHDLGNLPSVEAMRRLSNLSYLEMKNCPLLSERCKRGSGAEWYKIAHIASILIDNEYIQEK